MFTVAFLLIPEFSLMNVVAALETLRVANTILDQPAYRTLLVTDSTRTVPSSGGIGLATDLHLDDLEEFDLLLVCGSFKPHRYERRGTQSRIRRFARHGKAFGSLEGGVYHLAKAGVLDGEAVAAHYSTLATWSKLFPRVRFLRQLFTLGEKRVSSAGGVSSMDLMLALIERQQGRALALRVASLLLAAGMRPGEETQPDAMTMPDNQAPRAARDACRAMEETVAAPLAVAEVARRVGLSRRQLDRVLGDAFGHTAAELYMMIRLARARKLLRSSGLELAAVAESCGFSAYAHFARRYRRLFGRSPGAERRGPSAAAGPIRLIPIIDTHPDQNLLDPERLL